jgi:hypothetical protein
MATNIPHVLDGKEEVAPSRCSTAIYWTTLIVNFFAAFVETCFGFFFHLANSYYHETPSEWANIGLASMFGLCGILQAYYGAILMISVFRIRRFFVDRKATDYINTGMLIRHALAFGLYSVTQLTFYAAYILFAFNPNNPGVISILNIVGMVYVYGGFLAQLLLANIFWSLGKKDEDEKVDRTSDVLDVIVEEFDDDA